MVLYLKKTGETRNKGAPTKKLTHFDWFGPIAKLDKFRFVSGLPKTRSEKETKFQESILQKGDYSNFGDISTLLKPRDCREEIARMKEDSI
jgi:acetyl-CoA synthetase